MMKLFLRRRGVLMVGLALVLTGVLAVGYGVKTYTSFGENTEVVSEAGSEEDSEEGLLTLKAVHPKLNNELVRSVTQPAYVQAFHKAELMARVAGSVKAVHKNIGDLVKEGEVLIEIDVPDLEQDVAQKDALVVLAEQEVKAAETAVTAVRAAEKEAAALIREKQTDVQRALARWKYAQSVYRRVKQLADDRAVQASLVDERLKGMEAADAEYNSAVTAVETARANLEEFSGKLASAQVDVEVKKARVKVARAERAKVQSLLDYAKIRAPFNGVVVSRKVDPGAFIQNASTGQPHPLMTVLRTEQVTLVMWVPERDAALVQQGAAALVRLDALGREETTAKVSRLSHWLDPEKSRDMRVEVDLDNKDGRLKVGMYGSMTVVLQRFEKAPLLPTSAVFVRSGKTCICEVSEGLAHIVPVRVQLEDGIRVKVAKLLRRYDPRLKAEVETPVELSSEEVVVRSGQGEVHEGQEVKVTLEAW